MAHEVGDAPGPRASTLSAALRDLDAGLRSGTRRRHVWATGLTPLDGHLGGGLHAGDLVVLAGPPASGKTTLALQVACNVARSGGEVLYVCFDHTAEQLADRLLAMETGLAGGPAAASQDELARHLLEPGSERGLTAAMGDVEGGALAVDQLAGFADRVHLVAARGGTTDVAALEELAARGRVPSVIVVDLLQQLQQVATGRGADRPDVDATVRTLKALALDLGCAVLGVSAVDASGLAARRVRARHLQGSESLAYEADVVLVLQDKYDVVARQHLVYDLTSTEEHRRWLVCTVEKNRRGRDRVSVEFRKRFSHGHVDPVGRMVAEDLVDERVFTD